MNKSSCASINIMQFTEAETEDSLQISVCTDYKVSVSAEYERTW